MSRNIFFDIYMICHRFWLLNIRRKKLKLYMVTRKGSCKKCGRCCRKCIALDKKTKLCKIWNKTHDTYLGCRDFPMSPMALKYHNVEGVCGYYWEDKRE